MMNYSAAKAPEERFLGVFDKRFEGGSLDKPDDSFIVFSWNAFLLKGAEHGVQSRYGIADRQVPTLRQGI